jgi:hypothetical protein
MGGADMRVDRIENVYDSIGDFIAQTVWTITVETEQAVTIPRSVNGRKVTSIGDRAFASYRNLTAISVSAQNRQYQDIDGVLFTKDGRALLSGG